MKFSLTYLFLAPESGIDGSSLASWERLATWEKEFVDVLEESGYFATMAPGREGEMTIEARLAPYTNPVAVFVNIVNACMIVQILPSWLTEVWTITAQFKTNDGNEHSYQLEDSVVTVMWLPMIFLPPTMHKNIKEVRKNMWRYLILKMRQDGIFQQKSKTRN
jgi:hypothetical protein